MQSIILDRAAEVREDSLAPRDAQELNTMIQKELRTTEGLLQEEKLIVLALSLFLLFLPLLFELQII